MDPCKRIAIVAHDARKDDLVDWCRKHEAALRPHKFWATGTTGGRIREACPSLEITLLKSGPRGGDQQVGAHIAEGQIDVLIFFIDALSPHPHEADIQGLQRLSVLYDVVTATNRATADFLVHSPLFANTYERASGRPGDA